MLRYRFLANLIPVRRSFSSARDSSSGAGEQDLRDARAWLATLHAEAIPLKSIGELSFSRSSGPGGQNVNKYDNLAHWRRTLC
jgi:peptidyl-tRNA hydrolase ICT1